MYFRIKNILDFSLTYPKFIMEIYRNFRKKYWNKTTSDSNFAPTLINFYPLPDIKFNGHCLINNNNDSSLDIVNLYICYTLDRWSRDLDTDYTLGNCLFGSVRLTKNTDPD